jgi:hypothetical protein
MEKNNKSLERIKMEIPAYGSEYVRTRSKPTIQDIQDKR